METSRKEYAELFPQGRGTPGHHVFDIVENAGSLIVGELWYSCRPGGGKLRFIIEWIQIDPAYRRRGYATEVFRMVEADACTLGADRVELHVWMDNPGAYALYTRLGFTTHVVSMSKPVP